MKRLIFLMAVIVGMVAVGQLAAQQSRVDRPPFWPTPVDPGSPRPGDGARPAPGDGGGGVDRPDRDRPGHDRPGHHHPGRHGHRRPHYVIPYPYGYNYGYGYGYPYYPYYAPSYGGTYVLPPVWTPAESFFGPQSVQRFMGGNVPQGGAPNVNVIVPQRTADPPQQPKPNLRGTNRASLDLAWRFVGFGDAHFQNQKYTDANQRYRKATQVAPQLAAAYMRQGFALIALKRYDAAVKAIKRGLAAEPDWPKSNFEVDDLYGPNQIAKKSHLDTLAKEAAGQPGSADLHFLLGAFLHFDGQNARAKTFLDKAARLAGPDDAHIRAFPR